MQLRPMAYQIIGPQGTVVGTLTNVEGSAWWRAEWLDAKEGLLLPQMEPKIRYFDGAYAAEQFFLRDGV